MSSSESNYGLKQAPRAWYKHLTNCIRRLGFEPIDREEYWYFKNYYSNIRR